MRNLIIFVGVVLFFASCGGRRTAIQAPATCDVGVVINGVCWATRNVDTPGTFVKKSSDAGGIFTRYEAQDACPRGWRLPTREELQSLNAVGGEWTSVNGVNGHTFGTVPNQLFLPAAGLRNPAGVRTVVGNNGLYWSSSARDADYGWMLWFNSSRSSVGAINRNSSLSVRCVLE